MVNIFDHFASRRGISVCSLRFLLDDEKIGPDQTPKMLGFEGQETIDCMLEQGSFGA
jgi:Ubiquitin-2 like Rad60 SUMO-like